MNNGKAALKDAVFLFVIKQHDTFLQFAIQSSI